MSLELDPYDAAALALTDKFDYSVGYPDGWETGIEVRVVARVFLTTDQYTEWQKGVNNERRRPYPAGVR